jgi:hypothetical protein
MREFIKFLFWPVPDFKDTVRRAAGAIGTWFFCWIFLLIAIIPFLAAPAMAANAVSYDQGTVTIVFDGSTDFSWTELAGAPSTGIVVRSIQFNTSAANDVLVVHNGGLDAIPIFQNPPAGGVEAHIKYFPGGKRCRPVIDYSDCVVDTDANAIVIMEIDPL